MGVIGETPAARAGLSGGDVLLMIGDTRITTVADVQGALKNRLEQETKIRYRRDNAEAEVSVRPTVLDGSPEPRLGVSLSETGFVSYPWYQSLWLGPWYAIRMLGVIFASLGTLVSTLVQHGTVSSDVTGPIGIAVVTGQVVDLGIIYIIQFAALLSLSLAAMNVLPIPALDGGRALFVLIEKIRGRSISARVEGLVHTIGFYALLVLIAVISYRDFFRFGLNEGIANFFKNLVS
jgi:regulator of sigma E protease